MISSRIFTIRSIYYISIWLTLTTVSEYSYAQCNYSGVHHQLSGGTELMISPRPDISTTAYQVYLRLNRPVDVAGIYYTPFPTIAAATKRTQGFRRTDSCNGKFISISTTPPPPFTLNSLPANPFTAASDTAYIFKGCIPLNFPQTPFNYFPADTFIFMKEYWRSYIINMPYQCGKFQIELTRPTGDIDSSSNISYTCGSGTLHPLYGLFSVTNEFDEDGPTPLIQFQNIIPNQMPHYLSQLSFLARANQWTSFQMNPVDPEGDSLVFLASENIMPYYAGFYKGMNNMSAYGHFLPRDLIINQNTTDTLGVRIDTFGTSYACIPGQSGPNCTRYNYLNNPFDCDSTYSVNPQTGEVRFYTTTPNQYVYVTVKVDEYRQSTWLSTSYRVLRIFTIPAGYNGQPLVVVDTPNVQQAAIAGDLEFYACVGSNISIPIDLKEPQNLGQLNVSDDHSTSLPASNIVYQNNITDSVRALFTWSPQLADTGWHNVLFTIVDSSCSLSEFITTTNRVLRIYVSENGLSTIADTSICAGDSVKLIARGAGNYVQWHVLSGNLNSLSCTNCAYPTATPTKTTIYEVVSQLGSNCKSRDTVTINVQEKYSVSAPNVTACGQKDSVQLKATISSTLATAAQIISWQPIAGIIGNNNTKNIAVNPNIDTTYIITVADTLGCFMVSDTVNIRYDKNFSATLLTSKSDICIGDTVQLSILATGISGITYAPNYNITNLTGPATQVYPDTNTTYTATIKSNASNCEITLSKTITVANLAADAGPDHEIFDGEEVILGGPNYRCANGCELTWIPSIYIIDPGNYDMGRALVRARKSIRYVQILRSGLGGCEDRDTVNITVKCTDIYMPNIFSPNSENLNRKNHTFGPNNIGLLEMEFRIFNRWGQQVFYSTHPDNRWTGDYNGNPQPPGVYVWKIKARCPESNTIIEKVGNVTLVR